MELTVIFAFLGTAILLTLMPGPDILFVTAQSISQDKKAGIATSFGLCTGLLVHISAATLGISAIVYQSELAFTIVKFAGVAYLLFLAFKSFTAKQSKLTVANQQVMRYTSLYYRGIIMNLLNPKVSLFFLAFLPQFVDRDSSYVPAQMLALGVIFLVQALVIFSLVSVTAAKIRGLLLRSSVVSRHLNLIEGAIYTLIAVQIVFNA